MLFIPHINGYKSCWVGSEQKTEFSKIPPDIHGPNHGSLNTKEVSKNAGSKLSETLKYEQVTAGGLSLSEDISENFNFKRIITLST